MRTIPCGPDTVTCLLLVIATLATAFGEEVKPATTPFPLAEVQLLDGPFKRAMERNARYLLSIDPDRLLHNTRLYAGLKPKGELYGGWESKGIAGHTLGHYLTALSQQYAATGDRQIKEKLDYTVAEMAECQKLYGDGYIGALPPKELAVLRGFKEGKIELSGGFNFKGGAWVPWYTEHKILAGLKDAWVLGGNLQAREVALKMADWVDTVTAGLTPDQQQEMLRVEQGGMLETLVELYALTGEKRYLDTSRRFYHKAIMDPLLAGKDELTGKHANTLIPKVIGEARTYEVTGDPDARKISEYFWDTVVHGRSWVMGGNSDHEHFYPAGKAADFLTPATAETCNTYNMLKLTEHLFAWHPTAELGDYYERALYNHILASQDPKQGMFTYFVSLKPGHFRTYSTPFDSFWCCVGTGMENHTKYGEFIYSHADDSLYVNLFIPSELNWKEKGLLLEQKTGYPAVDFTELTFKEAPKDSLGLLIRCPSWMTGPLEVQLNGAPLTVDSHPGKYAEIRRVWKKDDRMRVRIPMGLHTEELEGNPGKVAFLYGPLVLAGDLGPVPSSPTIPYSAYDQLANVRVPGTDVPVLVRKGTGALTDSLKRLPGDEIAFRTEGLGKPAEVTLRPFNAIPYDYSNTYWTVVSEQDWKTREAEIQKENQCRASEEARIVDELRPGEQQSEVDHALASQDSQTGDFKNRKWRDARGWFEFQMKVAPGVPQVLRCTYWGGDDHREFDILVDGKPLASQKLSLNRPDEFVDVDLPIPGEMTSGKEKITIRFVAKPGSVAGGLFGGKLLKTTP